MSALSSQQFSAASALGVDSDLTTPTSPTAFSTQSASTAAKATAWTTRSLAEHGNTPMPYSRRTRGSFISWDDEPSAAQMPQPDMGSNFAMGR